MLETVGHVVWNAFAQPEWNSSEDVPRALALVASSTAETASAAYNRLLYAVGNNHAGTYFPVLLPVVPFLGEILRDGSCSARMCTMNVLDDLLASFQPEPGFETIMTPSGPQPVKEQLGAEVAKLLPLIERLSCIGSTDGERKLASELLSQLRDANS